MFWRQFFTPVQSMDTRATAEFINEQPIGSYTLLDVRQPKEYEARHISGAKLIPLGELDRRINEIDPDKPVIVY